MVSLVAASLSLMIEKTAVSGYVMPEHAFENTCRIYDNGAVDIIMKKGDGTITVAAKTLSKEQLKESLRLLEKAKKGSISESPMPCDIGTSVLRGYVEGDTVDLDLAYDCGTRRFNQSSATPVLTRLVSEFCGF